MSKKKNTPKQTNRSCWIKRIASAEGQYNTAVKGTQV